MTRFMGLPTQCNILVLPQTTSWNRILPASTVGSLPNLGRSFDSVCELSCRERDHVHAATRASKIAPTICGVGGGPRVPSHHVGDMQLKPAPTPELVHQFNAAAHDSPALPAGQPDRWPACSYAIGGGRALDFQPTKKGAPVQGAPPARTNSIQLNRLVGRNRRSAGLATSVALDCLAASSVMYRQWHSRILTPFGTPGH